MKEFINKVIEQKEVLLFLAFHSACKIGYSEMAEFLIEKFPDLDIDLKWSYVISVKKMQ